MISENNKSKKVTSSVVEIAIFAMLGALMYASKMLMNMLPNIHLIGSFIVAETIIYRKKALYPIYIFVFLTGLFEGFALWWIPYLYIWTILWGLTMLIPKNVSNKVMIICGIAFCSLHGFLYGTLYAPAQAIMFGLDFKGMISWIIAGLPFDAIHGVSNLFCGSLIIPLVNILKQSEKYSKL